jgi:phosphatidylserine decarboxylase
MMAGIAFNGRQTKKTNKVKKTANPVWNSSIDLLLTAGCPNIQIAVFDKHRRYSIYLGELRLSVVDLFEDSSAGQVTYKVPPQWYKLHSSSSQNAFVTGSIKVGFELVSKSDVTETFHKWKKTVVQHTKPINVNDQNFYSDTDTDVESLMLEEEEEDKLNLKGSSISDLTISQRHLGQGPNYMKFLDAPGTLGSGYDSNYTSDVSAPESSTPNTSLSSSIQLTEPFRRSPYAGESITGVVFLKIQSATGLPPFKRFIKKGFDMDPFVVISCGKKTFRTSWRKHTLSPVFNEDLAFDVFGRESSFDLIFNIFDKDHISFHDEVARGSIAMSDIINKKEFVDYDLKLSLHKEKYDHFEPHLKFSVKFSKYEDLKNELWSSILSKYSINQTQLDIVQLTSFLDDANIDEDLDFFFTVNGKNIENTLTISEVVEALQNHNIQLDRCPICGKRKHTDIVTHAAICSYKGNKLKSYATAGFASKRWYSKVLIKFAYGKYALGRNNANILVQDRLTGFIMEEKMSLYIRLGIRLLYKGKGADSKRIKNVLRSLSIKQGAKFDLPSSVKDIESFIKFHKLDLSECEKQNISEFKTFNEFFYRKLKPDARLPESNDDRIIVSAADSRCTTFQNITSAKKIWIKSRSFTVRKLLGDAYTKDFEDCSIAIFRLAPQDYHRFHSPVRGIVGESTYIQGEYYTVNPMAIRSDLDVYGDNVRVIIPIETEEFGCVFVVAVGAMMVGSTVLTVSAGDEVSRASELGYFKFGGSTIITLFQSGSMKFDSDLLANSAECIETLVRVGVSVGHKGDIDEHSREKFDFNEESEENKLRIIRTITGGDNDRPWELYKLNGFPDDDDDSDLEKESEDYEEEEVDDELSDQ